MFTKEVFANEVLTKESCNCTSVLEPICGSDGKVYRNRCDFNCTNNGNETITEKPRFYCTERCMVPLIYMPVCGSNRKTYVNKYAAECDQWAYPELNLHFVEAKKIGDSFIPEYEECKYDCRCPNKYHNNRTVCSTTGEVFKDGCDFYCAKWFWYKQLKLKEAPPELCGIFNVFAVELEKLFFR